MLRSGNADGRNGRHRRRRDVHGPLFRRRRRRRARPQGAVDAEGFLDRLARCSDLETLMAGTVGIDVGGTYTDLYFAGGDGVERVIKVPSTPKDPSIGLLDAPIWKR